jgi:hypothetical protein
LLIFLLQEAESDDNSDMMDYLDFTDLAQFEAFEASSAEPLTVTSADPPTPTPLPLNRRSAARAPFPAAKFPAATLPAAPKPAAPLPAATLPAESATAMPGELMPMASDGIINSQTTVNQSWHMETPPAQRYPPPMQMSNCNVTINYYGYQKPNPGS